ncbi:hypothetical protein ACJMK2_009068 [Sinanodonta woodiana]|uniref:Calcineurin-like phosphoesterase domain-containing protein n=1 Tax=Sinanodonta woodiana TaxID=1069815 RepID=A0ABD3VB46_SINWO
MEVNKMVKVCLAIIVPLILILFVTLQVLYAYYGQKARARLMRFGITLTIQIFFIVIGTVIWRNLSHLFDRFHVAGSASSFKNTSSASKGWKLVLFTILAAANLSYLSFMFLIGTEPYIITIFFFLSFGFVIQLFTGLILCHTVLLILKYSVRLKFRSAEKKDRIIGFIVVGYALFITLVGFYNANQPPTIRKVSVPIYQLPKSLHGLTITNIPDIHLGPTVGKHKLERIIHMVNYLQSDIVAISGDLVDGQVDQLDEAVEPIRWISAKYGVYFVTGNHEYYSMDIENWIPKLKSLGVEVLHNSNTNIPKNSKEQICLAGVDDPTADNFRYANHGMQLSKALESCDKNRPVILLAHQPKVGKIALESHHRVDLVLAGHTHGGQMFPVTIGAYLFNPYYAGLYRHGNHNHIYVSTGAAYWGFPIRFGTTSEITQITLVAEN